jgi:replicative DNA helicase
LSSAPLLIDDTPTRSMTEIAACTRRLKRKEGVGLVIIDYLQLIDPDDPRDPRQEQVAKIARRLKGMARQLEIPVMCLAQLNRQADTGREGHRPRLSHLRESGAIEQDADVVMFVHREEYFCTAEERKDPALDVKGKAQVILAKQRNGPIGDVELHWFEQYACFRNPAPEPDKDLEPYRSDDDF